MAAPYQSILDKIALYNLTITDPIDPKDATLRLSNDHLESVLNEKLIGVSTKGMPIRTRSKFVKELVCRALNYPVPRTFARAHPKFPGQDFDIFLQKNWNLQIWNEEITPDRRYVLIKVDERDKITKIKVFTGMEISKWDTTRTLTRKYQAVLNSPSIAPELVTAQDTDNLLLLIKQKVKQTLSQSPLDPPTADSILPIDAVFKALQNIIGRTFKDTGSTSERNRGAELHKLVCSEFSYKAYSDNGSFPDIPNQLIELKLQTAKTLDLGLVLPESTATLGMHKISGVDLRHCDVRYAIFYGQIVNGEVEITNLILSTGEGFFTRFTQYQGNVQNAKYQLPIPRESFD